METLVSIIIPVYNGEKYIYKCINSIKRQTYTNIEIIIINDGSNDKTKEILEKLKEKDSRIKILNKDNEGVSKARNDGIKLSNGEYIIFVDADDYIENDMVEILLNDVKEKNVNIARCNYQYVKENGTIEKNVDILYKLDQEYISGIELIDNIINRKTNAFSVLLIIKKELIQKNSFNFKLSLMEDVAFYTQLCVNEERIYIEKKCLYNVFLSSDSATRSNKNYLKKIEAIKIFNKEYRNILKENNLYSEERIKRVNKSNFIFIMDILLKMNETKVNRNEIINDYKRIFEDNKQIINQCNIKNIKADIKLPMKLGKKGYFNLMYYFLKFKNMVKKLINTRR